MKKYLLSLPIKLFIRVRVEAAKNNISIRDYMVLVLENSVKGKETLK